MTEACSANSDARPPIVVRQPQLDLGNRPTSESPPIERLGPIVDAEIAG